MSYVARAAPTRRSGRAGAAAATSAIDAYASRGREREPLPTSADGPVKEVLVRVYFAHFYGRAAAGVSFSVCILRTFTGWLIMIVSYNI